MLRLWLIESSLTYYTAFTLPIYHITLDSPALSCPTITLHDRGTGAHRGTHSEKRPR